MQIAVIAQRLGLPEERVAQMTQLVKMQGLSDEQMGQMMALASSRGVTRGELEELLGQMGVAREQIRRVMVAQGLVSAEKAAEAEALERAEEAARAKGRRREAAVAFAKKADVILFWLIVWEVADRMVDNRLMLAGPLRTLQALADQIAEADFWLICGASFVRIAAGFLLSFVVGVGLAVLAYHNKVVRAFFEPLVSLLRTIPVVSFIIMLLIWVGNQMLTVYLAFLIVLPLIYTNMLTGLESVDASILEMARTYRLSRLRTFWYIYRPALMPFLTSSCKISLGMSWKSGVMAEVLATPKPSIGKEMANARQFLNTPDLFAWTVVVMVLSFAFEKLFMWLLEQAGKPMGGRLGAREDKGGSGANGGA